jgi:hypothetical protein
VVRKLGICPKHRNPAFRSMPPRLAGLFQPPTGQPGAHCGMTYAERGELVGWEVAKQAREIDPAFPIVYMTGTGADE